VFLSLPHKFIFHSNTFFSSYCLSFYIFIAIQQEKSQHDFINGIEHFNRTSLKHAETQEKNPLPTKEVIDQEKAA